MPTLRISLKKIPRRLNLLNGSRIILRVKKCCLLFSLIKKTPPLHHPKNDFMIKWHLIQPLQREIYKKPTLTSYILVRSKIFGHVSHSTELVRMCLACQHFDFNSADWISDNLHVISSRCLRTMRKEFIFQFSRRSSDRSAWLTSKNVCVGG